MCVRVYLTQCVCVCSFLYVYLHQGLKDVCMCSSVSLYGLCISSYYGKYEVFDLQVTLTLIFYLQMTLSLVKASQHDIIAKLFIMNNLRYLTLK